MFLKSSHRDTDIKLLRRAMSAGKLIYKIEIELLPWFSTYVVSRHEVHFSDSFHVRASAINRKQSWQIQQAVTFILFTGNLFSYRMYTQSNHFSLRRWYLRSHEIWRRCPSSTESSQDRVRRANTHQYNHRLHTPTTRRGIIHVV